MNMVNLPLNCCHLNAYLLDCSLIIYSKLTHRVYGFKEEGASLFLKIDELLETHSDKEIIKNFPKNDLSILNDMISLARGKEDVKEILYEPDMEMGVYIKDSLDRVSYEVDNIVFYIHYPSKQFFNRFHSVYKHLHVKDPIGTTAVNIDFIKNSDLWEIHWNDVKVEMSIPEPRIATFLQEKMMTSCYQAQDYLISLHSAAVEKNNHIIILPAVAESGKTTLTASLINNGFNLFSDEVTSLDNQGRIHPLPFCMNIKEGSWKILSKIYPELNTGEIHSRFDGQSIRFLPPRNMAKERKKATHIIFPKYIPDSGTHISAISSVEALAKIQEASYQVKNDMDDNKFELIMKNLISLPKYTLVYSDLNEARDTINKLLEQ